MTYTVHYRLDDVRRSPGRCRTGHRLDKGAVFYAQEGRAIVRSCIPDVAVDDTYRRHGRLLRSLR